MRSDVFLFFGILILLFVVWVATGGPSRPISFTGPYITPISTYGDTSTGYSLSKGEDSPVRTNQDIQEGIYDAQDDLIDLQKSLVEAKRFGTPSVYKGQVTLGSSGTVHETDEDEEYITLYVSGRATNGIAITGWRIQSEATGKWLRIPQGVNLPRSAVVNDKAPIVMLPGQSATITVGESPVGMSFRENKCTGYFDQFQNFSPPLYGYCPDPRDDFERFYLGNSRSFDACQAYIDTVDRCTVPLRPPSKLSNDCMNFIDDYLNYKGCVVAHSVDRDFFSDQWRIYLGEDDEFFTKTHDTIKLLDSVGNTVDLISY